LHGEKWPEFANSVDLFKALNTGNAYLVVDKSLLGNDNASPVKFDIWETDIRGDVTGDGKLNVSDVTALINTILGISDEKFVIIERTL
jgi:hypothetical protein